MCLSNSLSDATLTATAQALTGCRQCVSVHGALLPNRLKRRSDVRLKLCNDAVSIDHAPSAEHACVEATTVRSARQRPHLAGVNRLAAGAAGWHQLGAVAATGVFEDDRTTARTCQVAIAPLHQADHHRIEIDASARQVVLEARWMLLV